MPVGGERHRQDALIGVRSVAELREGRIDAAVRANVRQPVPGRASGGLEFAPGVPPARPVGQRCVHAPAGDLGRRASDRSRPRVERDARTGARAKVGIARHVGGRPRARQRSHEPARYPGAGVGHDRWTRAGELGQRQQGDEGGDGGSERQRNQPNPR